MKPKVKQNPKAVSKLKPKLKSDSKTVSNSKAKIKQKAKTKTRLSKKPKVKTISKKVSKKKQVVKKSLKAKVKKTVEIKLRTTRGLENISPDNLEKFDHIIVLMMENRSFDHMLGYHSYEPGGLPGIDGLKHDCANYYKGEKFIPSHLGITAFPNNIDPPHDPDSVDEQLANDNGGFVKTFIEEEEPPVPLRWIVMGYYNADDIPLFDYLSRKYCVCNKWYSSVPGQTWPNRLYSVTGRSNGSRDNALVPIYDIPSFVRHLDNNEVSWNWYRHDVSTLRLIDADYRTGSGDHFHNFENNFEKHVKNGKLASVSWIDPNFTNLWGASSANDDHPPADIKHGQLLMSKVYDAVHNSPYKDKTLLVIVYDEHGGFYDHVHPKEEAPDDDPEFRRYGARVPAFVISPYVSSGIPSNILFDHTSIIKTILLKFCRDSAGNIPDMGMRVNSAHHLGELLTESDPVRLRGVNNFPKIKESLNTWAENFTVSPYESTRGIELNELQEGIIRAKFELEKEGLPLNSP